MEIIRYRGVSIRQQEKEVLCDIDFSLQKGQFVYLIGEVGSGKSSLLKTMYGEVDIYAGSALVLDYDLCNIKRKQLPALRKRLGIVFQDFQLLTDRTVYDNLDFVLKSTGWSDKTLRDNRIKEVLDLVKLPTKGHKMPNELSGGEQQRVVIARAILNEPDIILADEPTGNLDACTGRQIVSLLHDICAKDSSVIMVTHQEQWIEEFPGRVVKCKDHSLLELTKPQEDIKKEDVKESDEDTIEDEAATTETDVPEEMKQKEAEDIKEESRE